MRCVKKANMALYAGNENNTDADKSRHALAGFAARFGLGIVEDHRSAAADGIVALEVVQKGGRSGYIPYTNKPINWHTDGYYNTSGPDIRIRSMILHCVRQAAIGGSNELLDHEIAYIRLRDENPDYITALQHPEAMTIPAHFDATSGKTRPASIGAVFEAGPSGALHMRYTARKRNVIWRNDQLTREAIDFLGHVLATDPLIISHTMEPGQGIICNNVLHTRTTFANDDNSPRLLYRARYMQRISPQS
jgi:hypothetical protein